MLPGTGNWEVFANKRSLRDEKSFELIGKYDSFATEQNFKLDLDRVDYWMTNALRSEIIPQDCQAPNGGGMVESGQCVLPLAEAVKCLGYGSRTRIERVRQDPFQVRES